jgi:hypothetical protein
MTLRRSRGAYKGHHTKKKKKLASLKRRRFPRQSPGQTAEQLRHWVRTGQIPWTPELLKLVVDDAKKQGVSQEDVA